MKTSPISFAGSVQYNNLQSLDQNTLNKIEKFIPSIEEAGKNHDLIITAQEPDTLKISIKSDQISKEHAFSEPYKIFNLSIIQDTKSFNEFMTKMMAKAESIRKIVMGSNTSQQPQSSSPFSGMSPQEIINAIANGDHLIAPMHFTDENGDEYTVRSILNDNSLSPQERQEAQQPTNDYMPKINPEQLQKALGSILSGALPFLSQLIPSSAEQIKPEQIEKTLNSILGNADLSPQERQEAYEKFIEKQPETNTKPNRPLTAQEQNEAYLKSQQEPTNSQSVDYSQMLKSPNFQNFIKSFVDMGDIDEITEQDAKEIQNLLKSSKGFDYFKEIGDDKDE